MRSNAFIGLQAVLLLVVLGCTEAPELDTIDQEGLADGSEEIYYRGERRVATRVGKLLIIEGDIAVSPADMWGPDDLAAEVHEGDDGVAVASAQLRIQGANFQWPGGVVPFRFGNYNNTAAGLTLAGAMSNAQQTLVQNAMDAWERLVPGLNFRPQRNSDANFLTFNLSTVCSSRVGRNPGDNELAAPLAGEQIVRATANCLNVASIHHEIGHALGVLHEHTRRDRNTFVGINWANIRGCNNTATGPTAALGCGVCTTPATAANCGCSVAQVNNNTCNSFNNFVTDGSRADIGTYDYGSVMHYNATAFTKNGLATINVLQLDPSGSPFAIGQRVQISDGDALVMNAMYPELNTRTTFFQDTGNQVLCELLGRDEDRIGTNFTTTDDLPTGVVSNGILDTDIDTGDYSVDCAASSSFWASNYSYPNTTVAFNSGLTADTYATPTVNVRVLDSGLIPIMFGI